MSLLMEALRKAEAAKNKADGKETDDASNLSLEPKETTKTQATESVPFEEATPPSPDAENQLDEHAPEIEQVNFGLESKPDNEVAAEKEPNVNEAPQSATEIADELLNDAPEEPFDLSMDSTIDGADELDSAIPEPEFVEPLKDISENTTLEALDQRARGADELSGYIPEEPLAQEEPSAQEKSLHEEPLEHETTEDVFEPIEAAEELTQFERSVNQAEDDHPMSDQAILDRQTANSLFQAKQNTQQNKRKRVIMLGLIIALLPIGGGSFYWYYTSSVNSSNMFPNAAITPPSDGFLGEATAANVVEPAITSAAIDTDLAIEADTAATENIDLGAIVAVLEAVESPNISLDSTEDTSPATDASITLIAGNTQTTQTDNSLVQNTTAAPVIDIRLTRTTSQPEVNPDLLAAYESYQQNDLVQARRLYTQVLRTQPNTRDALLGLALINRQEGNIAQTQALYSRLLQLNPRDPLARAGLLESGQNINPTQQESQLRALQNEYPNVAPLAFALGNLFASQSRWNEAQNAYFDALLIANEVDSNAVSPDYAFNLAVSLERLNQLTLAYNYYQQALELSSASPAGFNLDNLNQRMAYLEQALQ
ncbi:MAG: hypothetical protein COA71_09895 [SAR86 cluster bacterium]|uniref:Tetratricopeptide repeat-like domain-containing protein n=1 Tax=SAR86 cluster bacterium TaxID=2030880 RepID=A0A2A5CAX0_9GAMM|nr:MAG: hypothetical protein COA71_09895 [SAR86 cluster bacterium]